MRPSERTHHNVKRLRAVFAVSTLVLLAVTVWMLAADHRREWKDYQRTYRDRVESPGRPLEIEQINLSELTVDYHFCRVARADRCTTCHQGVAVGGPDAAGQPRWPQPWMSHPRLDLYVGPNSPHPMADFGCTICHDGQGSATEFRFASHSPNDMRQRSDWRKRHGWFRNDDWDYPMLARRFAQSRCLQCHADVTDLEPSRRFPDPPAPKLLAGYHLVRQHGCFGCHEIKGVAASGERLGPDMRLEPNCGAAALQLAATESSLTERQRTLARRIAGRPDDPALRRRLVESIDAEELRSRLSPRGMALVDYLSAEAEAPGTMRKVGPSLRDVAARLDRRFLVSWIGEPVGFRPETRMPRLFGLDEHLEGPARERASRLEAVEVEALAEFLLDASQPVKLEAGWPGQSAAVARNVTEPPSAERGRRLLLTQGCLACHKHDDYPQATGTQGPDLSRLGAKYASDRAARWLADWLRDPARHAPRTRMPNSLLEPTALARGANESGPSKMFDPVADLVAYLLGSAGPPAEASHEPSEANLDELILAHLSKRYSREQAEEILRRGLSPEEGEAVLDDRRELIGPMSRKKKLRYLGRRTIAKRGCYGCHDIPGFELSRPIGPALSDWGRKGPTLLAFGRIEELLAEDGTADRAETDPDVGFYHDAIHGRRREGFVWQKLRAPRSFDYGQAREKGFNEWLRMGRFTLSPDEREAVATFVLGLVAGPPASKYVYQPGAAGRAIVEGRKVLDRYACAECHVLEMDRWQFEYDPDRFESPRPGDEFVFLQPQFSREQLKASMQTDLRGFAHAEVAGMPRLAPDGRPAVFEGDEEDTEGEPLPMHAFSLWQPATIAGQPWTVGGADVLLYDYQIRKQYTPWGGAAARLLYPAALADARASGVNLFDQQAWGRLPPPLVGQGAKVRPDWLADFLVDPQPIRPAAMLRMPKYTLSTDEVGKLIRFFAARSRVRLPYTRLGAAGVSPVLPNRHGQDARGTPGENSGATRRFDQAMRLITDRKMFCAKCHVIGDYRPGGTATKMAPDLENVGRRLRGEYVRRWLAHPRATLPYTPMPVNFPPSGDPLGQDLLPGSSTQQIEAVVELLIGYDDYLRSRTSTRKRIEETDHK